MRKQDLQLLAYGFLFRVTSVVEFFVSNYTQNR